MPEITDELDLRRRKAVLKLEPACKVCGGDGLLTLTEESCGGDDDGPFLDRVGMEELCPVCRGVGRVHVSSPVVSERFDEPPPDPVVVRTPSEVREAALVALRAGSEAAAAAAEDAIPMAGLAGLGPDSELEP